MIFVGDVHGKYKQYSKIMDEYQDTIQVGDMGVGFRRWMGLGEYDPYSPNPPYDKMVAGGHRFIRGNHDNPGVCRSHTQCIKDGTIIDEMMLIGGALSIDKQWRMPNYTWWEDEELSRQELETLLDVYCITKPRIMVTHDCPEPVAMAMNRRTEKLEYPSITRQAFQSMFEIHQPDVWVYGHWHRSFDEVIDGTRFVCLNELEVKDI
jgi:hypothetical protein